MGVDAKVYYTYTAKHKMNGVLFMNNDIIADSSVLTNLTLWEAKSIYGDDVVPLWHDVIYSKYHNLESRRYIGCKTKLLDWIFDIIDQNTDNVHSFCDIFAGTASVANRAIEKYMI